MKSLLSSKVIICAGSGGVGKTTISAALGCLAASEGMRVLVLTIDPAKRLKTILGLNDHNEVIRVPNQNYKGVLYAGVVDSEKVFENFIRQSAKSKISAEKILNNILYKQLSTTLSGSEEFTSIVKLYDSTQSGEYDLVILDTPPSQHAIDFLEAPDRIYTLFQSSVTKWFSEQAQGANFFTQFISRGTSLALSALQKVTGSDFIKELFSFFTSLKEIQGNITYKCEQTKKLLKDKKTSFILVTSFDQSKHFETENFSKQLSEGGFNLTGLIVNKAYPAWYKRYLEGKFKLQSIPDQFLPMADSMIKYYTGRSDMYGKISMVLNEKSTPIFIEEWHEQLTGLDELTKFSRVLSSIWS